MKPVSGRALFGLPGLLGLDPTNEVGFDHTSPGAAVGRVGRGRLELSAEGWELAIVADGEGRVGAGTHAAFPMSLGERRLKLRCRPADPATGSLLTTARPGSGVLDGEFRVELAVCESAGSGKTMNWPPAPLTLRGRFERLPLREG